MKIFVEDIAAIALVADVLEQANAAANGARKAPVELCLLDPSLPGEVEIDIGTEFAVNPQVKGAIKSLPGVMAVEEV